MISLAACGKDLSMPEAVTLAEDREEIAEAAEETEPMTESGTEEPSDAESTVPIEIVTSSIPEYRGLTISEVVTDPQRDWNDTTGGNGTPFDNISGTGTIGSTDEWVEIVNDSPDATDISGFSLAMTDGTDETEIFSAPRGIPLFSEGGAIENFGAGEILVIGNPPGDLKNSVTLTLFDAAGTLVDEVIVENGDAHTITDESFQINDDEWMMGEATPGF